MPSPIFLGQSAVVAHQSWLNTVGNNLANVNTFGFKGSRVRFGDIMGASVGGNTIGNGVSVTGVDVDFSQGALQGTGQALDVALDGGGFFTLSDGNQNVYTRVGSFEVDETKFLVDRTTGFKVLDTQGSTIKITPSDFRVDGTATTQIDLVGNLDSNTPTSGTFAMTVTAFDVKGNENVLNITWERVDGTTNQWTGTVTSPSGATVGDGDLEVTFDSSGAPPAPASDASITVTLGGQSQTMTIKFTDTLMNSGASNIKESFKDGTRATTFSHVVISESGEVKAVTTDGSAQTVKILGVAIPDNAAGFEQLGNGIFKPGLNTGNIVSTRAGEAGAGSVRSGFLEASNVDLTTELVNLIVAQRGFSTGAKIITTADQVLQETLQIKR